MLGQVTRGSADAAAHVQDVHSLGEMEPRAELDGRLAPAGVELIDRRKIGRGQPVEVLACGSERVEDRSFQIALSIVPLDTLFDIRLLVHPSFLTSSGGML